ncbi:low molecular weight phosphatase family protein [Microbacterium sp. lyk4-40-TSB-66]|uniref:arsenate reductase/protein-tyrosine-phosphatase family protein n=1 Tax=Microbacterium sp. lyk4-40-TSB-66 TaxID=3040294 RepID=UPI00254A58C2|nr:low molecular weight phosphatase family protein [Microbacterium sp. lyk4-40-TSB-66]
MLNVLTVCTGNICRSPLAALTLEARTGDLEVRFASAGTRARDGGLMTEEAIDLAVERGVPSVAAHAHRARLLMPDHLQHVDLVVAMTREHRRAVVEMDPSRLRMTFTARELVRAIDGIDDHALASTAAAGDAHETDPQRARFAALLAGLRARRGLIPSPADPADDDVIDPYRRSVATYRASAVQLDPGLDAVERLVRLAVGAAPGSADRDRVEDRSAPGVDAGTVGPDAVATPRTRRDLRRR